MDPLCARARSDLPPPGCRHTVQGKARVRVRSAVRGLCGIPARTAHLVRFRVRARARARARVRVGARVGVSPQALILIAHPRTAAAPEPAPPPRHTPCTRRIARRSL
eukprot:scaffold85483_cov49-Phaeocystis_antarctica.AAC.1